MNKDTNYYFRLKQIENFKDNLKDYLANNYTELTKEEFKFAFQVEEVLKNAIDTNNFQLLANVFLFDTFEI